jgi:hypothetical protein
MSAGSSNRGYFILTLAPLSGDAEYTDAGTFDDFDEAMREAEKLSGANQDKGVYLSEAAVFKVGRSSKEEPMMFWWNKPYADMLEEVPRARGYGYHTPKRGGARFIEYEPDPAFQTFEDLEEQLGDADEAESDEAEYATGHCESCGKIVPLYELSDFTTSEEAGRLSGSTRTGRSSSRRTSPRSSSYTSGSSSSSSSGRGEGDAGMDEIPASAASLVRTTSEKSRVAEPGQVDHVKPCIAAEWRSPPDGSAAPSRGT